MKMSIQTLCSIAVLIAVSVNCATLSTPEPTSTPAASATPPPTKTNTPIPPTATNNPTPTFTATPILPTPDISFRKIRLSDFHGNLLFDFPISLEIPREYARVTDAPIWMPKQYTNQFDGQVPIEADFLRVMTTTNVGYDAETNTFIGVPYTEQEKKDYEEQVNGKITFIEQREIGGFPIVIIETSDINHPNLEGYTKVNILYLATLIGTNTIFISTFSSPENFLRNEYIWARLISSLSPTN